MKIYIPTYGRSDRQVTLLHLPATLRRNTTLVVQKREDTAVYQSYVEEFGCDLIILPPKIQTLAPTRQWIIEHHLKTERDTRLVMLDDDLVFDTRRKDDPTKFTRSTDKEVIALFKDIEKQLLSYAQVGVLAREGGNRVTENYIYNTRIMRVNGYDAAVFKEHGIRFDRNEDIKGFDIEDFDVVLQILRAGEPNCVICTHVQGQGSSNAEGGLSGVRSPERHARSCARLAKLHHPFVKLVKKKTKAAWGGGERTDVLVQWKKAYARSQR